MADGGFHVPESIAAKVLAPVPARDHNNMVFQPLPLQHLDNHHARPGFSVIIFDRITLLKEGPGVVGCLGELLLSAQLLDKGSGL